MKYYIIVITVIALGFGLFLVQSNFCDVNTFWYNAVGNVASATLIGGLLTLLQHIILKSGEEKKLMTLFQVSGAIRESGLTNILTDCSEYNYHDLITNSDKFSVIMNDGQRWVGNNSPALEKRFNRKGKVTEIFVVNPSSDFCKALANKTDVDINQLKTKIEQTVVMLNNTYQKSQKKGSLKIYYLKNYPTQTLFYTEDTVVVTPYQTSSGRNIIPLYEYHYKEGVNSIGNYLHNDLEKVRIESLLIFEDGVNKQ